MSSPGPGACREYHDHLREIRRRNFEGKDFYHQPQVISWMMKKAPETGFSNVERLVREVYANEKKSFLPRIEMKHFPLFAVLLHEEIQCGHMFHIFQMQSTQDLYISVEDLSNYYERTLRDLESLRLKLPSGTGVSDYKEVIKAFDRVRWSFSPVSLNMNMSSVTHASAILPFCYREVINDKGGTASVYLHGIQQDLVEDPDLRKALEHSKSWKEGCGSCYQLAVKSYMEPMKSIYEIESEAFQGIRDQQGVVQYLGEYRLQHSTIGSPSHHIMLEYGEMDLDEYLAETYPPVLNGEIKTFWEEFFSVAETIGRIHNLEYDKRDGKQQRYRGWHGDIKPDNILRVRGQYKLADFGFAKFERQREGNTKTLLAGGTRTYGAPECDFNRYATRTPLSQTIDTWSFGCVLSSVATWVVLGSQAYENYNERRKIAIKALKAKKATDASTSVPSCEDAFHDGKKVLRAVTDWHVYLRNSARRADTTTHRVLDLVDKEMLLPIPEDRLMMGNLCKKLVEVLCLSDYEYRQNLEAGNLKTIGPETLDALQELDNLAPPRAIIAQNLGSEANLRNSGGYGGVPQTEAVADKPRRPNKTRKSERFDKIVLAKTANRVLPSLSESPKQLPEGTYFASGVPAPRDGKRQEEIPDIRLDNNEPTSVKNSSSSWKPQEEPLGMQPYNMASPESLSPASSGTEVFRQLQGQSQRPITMQLRSKSVQSSFESFHESFKETRPETFELPDSTAVSTSARTPGRFDVPNFTHDIPANESSSNSQISGPERRGEAALTVLEGKDPEPSETAIFQEYTVLNRNWGDQKKSWTRRFQGVPQDKRLKRFIFNRDVVFVVDNAHSMLRHWDALKITLLTLAMKIGSLDEDGLDLVYTCGDNNNVLAKGWDIPKVFSRSLDEAKSIMNHHDKTNIEEALSKRFDSHMDKGMQRQTLIVLTNGLWEGSRDWQSAEEGIARYVDNLRESLQKREKRWFTIQFISFGQNQKALDRLQGLDDVLRGPDGKIAEDVVDTKPWYFHNVESLILGSINEAEDLEEAADVDKIDNNPASAATARTPSPSPSMTAVRDLGRRTSKHVSRFSKYLGKDR